MYRFLPIILFAFGAAQFAEYDDEIELTLEDQKNKVMDRINNYVDTNNYVIDIEIRLIEAIYVKEFETWNVHSFPVITIDIIDPYSIYKKIKR